MNWLENFKPERVVYDYGGRKIIVIIAAVRVFRVAHRKGKNENT